MPEQNTSERARPIIVVKKTKGGGGHHGGAWKVAYADFVTAMMALFIVLWLMSCSQEVKQAVGGYFLDPKGHGKQAGSAVAGDGESLKVKQNEMNQLRDKLQQAIKEMPDFKKIEKNVKMTVTGEGLRIELLEGDKGTFFESGKPQPSAAGATLLATLANELGQIPNQLVIEGHTDAKPFPGVGYTNWELSADRANAARRLMGEDGLRPNQVMQVRGFADQDLRVPSKPFDPSNRRVSVIVQYRNAQPVSAKAQPPPQH
ncbi:MAG TPA: flagellar motor protein MotB [Bryobacteraceae bacterium]|jgi:chemotaxis protein MotB|nr:flagellar motor protein MotB [Bryobacteraceae bacterium]